jgi:hypothetical protein
LAREWLQLFANSASIAGDFTGIVSVLVTERPPGQPEQAVLGLNQTATPKISSSGAIRGSLQICAASGSVTPGVNNRFAGTVTLTG